MDRDFTGVQRIIDLMAKHSHQALPRVQLLFAQRPRYIGEHQQLMRLARSRGNRRAARSTGPTHPEKTLGSQQRRACQIRRQAEMLRRFAHGLLGA